MGSVGAIFVADEAAGPMRQVDEVTAVAGSGLEGDRYQTSTGSFSKNPLPNQQVTLIELEAIQAVNRDCDVSLEPSETRRNIVTSGVALNHLVDEQFTVGSVKLHGLKLCEPCGHLERLTRTGVKNALLHRGGLRAAVLTGGTIRVGDSVREDSD